NMGRWYRDGRLVARDDGRAVDFFRRAVRLGDRGAMNNLAGMYETGRGVERDPAEAARLYRRAAGLDPERGS
ncbi:MAG: sel1 repeat family protein, partial [Alphaproteobacteria bacterium]|nr:sel1 repeat family protein [Alphaproteobacteria bacterium]